MNEEEKIKLFLEELSALTRKHGIAVGGCGCCNSPHLIDHDLDHPEGLILDESYGYAGDKDGGNLRWSKKK